MKSRMAMQPRLHPRMFVTPIVVHDQMKVQMRWRFDIEPLEKSDELLVPMTCPFSMLKAANNVVVPFRL
jgi:hypothetical protein